MHISITFNKVEEDRVNKIKEKMGFRGTSETIRYALCFVLRHEENQKQLYNLTEKIKLLENQLKEASSK